MTKIFKQTLDKIEELEFFSIVGWASVKAFITVLLLFLTGYYILPLFLSGNATAFSVSFIVTFFTMAHVFKVKRDEYDRIIVYSIGSFLYSTILYLFGELIFVGLVLFGILIVVTFIIGEGFLTSIYSYIDLKKWLTIKIAEEKREEKLKLEEQKERSKGE